MADTVTWTGTSGKKYTYWVHKLDANWTDKGGNYIFAKLNAQNRWEAIYIGQTDTLSRRLTAQHERLPCAIRQGYTHVHAHTNGTDLARRTEETDLIQNYDPPCNRLK